MPSDVGTEDSSSWNDGWAWMSSAMVEEGEMEVMIIHTLMSPMLALGFIRDPMRPLVSSKAVYLAWMKSSRECGGHHQSVYNMQLWSMDRWLLVRGFWLLDKDI